MDHRNQYSFKNDSIVDELTRLLTEWACGSYVADFEEPRRTSHNAWVFIHFERNEGRYDYEGFITFELNGWFRIC